MSMMRHAIIACQYTAGERADSIAAERLAGVRTVRTFAAEEAEVARYSAAVEEAAGARSAATAVHALHLALFAAVGRSTVTLSNPR